MLFPAGEYCSSGQPPGGPPVALTERCCLVATPSSLRIPTLGFSNENIGGLPVSALPAGMAGDITDVTTVVGRLVEGRVRVGAAAPNGGRSGRWCSEEGMWPADLGRGPTEGVEPAGGGGEEGEVVAPAGRG